MFEIEKDVPPPQLSSAVRATYPLKDMEVGDSFVFSLLQRNNIAMAMSQMKRRVGKIFTMKKIDDSTGRVWRIQ